MASGGCRRRGVRGGDAHPRPRDTCMSARVQYNAPPFAKFSGKKEVWYEEISWR